jgi:hypothetical protein
LLDLQLRLDVDAVVNLGLASIDLGLAILANHQDRRGMAGSGPGFLAEDDDLSRMDSGCFRGIPNSVSADENLEAGSDFTTPVGRAVSGESSCDPKPSWRWLSALQ